MTTQTVYARMVQGQTGVSATLRSGTPTALVATAASVTEQAGGDPDPGLYAVVFSTLVAAGTYTLKLVKSGTVYATRTVTLTGVDGETAVAVGEAVVLDSDSITAVQSGLATSASITTLRGADNDTLKTLSDQIDGISSGGTDWTANERTAIRSILGVPASGTTPADPSVGILDTIRDSVGTYIAGISAVASTTTGTIVGFPSSLNLGDSYTEEANSDIHVFIRDENDDPIAAVGDFNFTDPEFAPEVNITQSGSTGRVKAVVTFIEASPEDYLKVEIPSSQSRRASPGTATIQCLLKWVDTDGKVLCQKTLSKQAVTWNEMV